MSERQREGGRERACEREERREGEGEGERMVWVLIMTYLLKARFSYSTGSNGSLVEMPC